MLDIVTSVLNVLDLQVFVGCSLYGLWDGQTQGWVIHAPDQEDWDGVVEVKLDTPTDLTQETPVVIDGRGQGLCDRKEETPVVIDGRSQGLCDREKGRDTGSN